ncbi:hypothetical protein PGH47_42845 (plasmid) [Streptomyces sp. HUAS 31]|uniref:hypothetical protein n=1 Tax=Streptomyces TaxID=1883 RepID=UPI0023050DCA|nr:hypothetical protein [Streptomyces sp. HUAS 31]WCE02487.1 hypothetical protein PGH47_42845 [Streptomyces sp. HUAS 31]
MSRVLNRACWAGGLALLVASGSLVAVPAARADDGPPTDRELLAKCDNGTKKCVFHPTGDLSIVPGEDRGVGARAYNCTDDDQTSSRTWEETTEESNSLKISLKQEFESEFLFIKVFKMSFEQSFGRTWSSSHTEGETTVINVPAGEVGWVTVAPKMQKVRGTVELIFKDRFHGKRYWYVPFEATGPAEGEPGVKTQRTRPMTAEERGAYCG